MEIENERYQELVFAGPVQAQSPTQGESKQLESP